MAGSPAQAEGDGTALAVGEGTASLVWSLSRELVSEAWASRSTARGDLAARGAVGDGGEGRRMAKLRCRQSSRFDQNQ